MTNADFKSKIQYRLAQISVGPSAIRNQGAPLMIQILRNHFMQMNLDTFFKVLHHKEQFQEYLNDETETILKAFPENGKSWGAARKGLNLFLREVVYNHYMAQWYSIPNNINENTIFLQHLEVPLDKDVATGLIEACELPKTSWKSIKELSIEQSTFLQEKALELAQNKQTARIHLDLMFWRKDR